MGRPLLLFIYFYLLTNLPEGIELLDQIVIENSSLALEITAPTLQNSSVREDDSGASLFLDNGNRCNGGIAKVSVKDDSLIYRINLMYPNVFDLVFDRGQKHLTPAEFNEFVKSFNFKCLKKKVI
ncbi:hypothetical protein [Coxiella-like endosymbiont]|uniref:hypothetical protein n=1 Tax=Coxiella-like endosymbiont TaxID=1592897 RepID=UPI00272CA14A|nr:hypothetical protein [Coxiella-like endosymbiont]